MPHAPPVKTTNFRDQELHTCTIGACVDVYGLSRFMGSAVEDAACLLSNAVVEVTNLQCADGSFRSTALDLASGEAVTESDTFCTALVAWLLSDLSFGQHASTCVARAAAWLARQRAETGLWTFRGQQGEFPPDLDDTAVALLALLNCGLAKSDEAALIEAYFEQNDSGLFGTWAQDWHPTRQTWDVTANLHALLLLQATQHPRLQLLSALEKQIGHRPTKTKSPYYCSPLPYLTASVKYLSAVGAHSQVTRHLIQDARRAATDVVSECAFAHIAKAPCTKFDRLLTRLGCSPLYRRRRFPVFYTSDAVTLAYLSWLTSTSLRLEAISSFAVLPEREERLQHSIHRAKALR